MRCIGPISSCAAHRNVTMSPPVPRVNTFFRKTSKPIVEPVSKIFIIASLILGINRLPLLGVTNTYCTIFMLIYSVLITLPFFYLNILWIAGEEFVWSSLSLMDGLEQIICTALGFAFYKRLQSFYLNLNKFDSEIGINVTTFGFRESVFNFLQLIVTITLSTILFLVNGNLVRDVMTSAQVIPVKLMNCFELHYYGHLISLIIPRLKAISDCMKSSYPCNKNRNTLTNSPDSDNHIHGKSHIDMKELMDLYNNIITAHDCLNEAVKWQMITLLMSSFSITLFLLYNSVKTIISGSMNQDDKLLISISLIVMQLCPLLVPCVFADRVQREVRLIKDLLTCKLYENTLDKPNRSTARTLLTLIETRNLSFSLFNMFDIDSSLPFKFLALLLTYLIILLQFDKVISPSKST